MKYLKSFWFLFTHILCSNCPIIPYVLGHWWLEVTVNKSSGKPSVGRLCLWCDHVQTSTGFGLWQLGTDDDVKELLNIKNQLESAYGHKYNQYKNKKEKS